MIGVIAGPVTGNSAARMPRRRRRTFVASALAVALMGVMPGCSADAGGTASPDPAPTDGSTPTATDASADTTVGSGSVDARVIEHAGQNVLVVTLPMAQWEVRVDWDQGGTMLADLVEADDGVMAATNAGIFTPEMRPGGLLVSDGEERVSLNLNDGGGNFHLKPNAVFAVMDDGTATIVDSVNYESAGVLHATQSGPALLLDGEIHPEFREGSTNFALRNGVGVSPDGDTVYLALTGWTNLWDFATLFRDELGASDALYLDGQISDLWVTGMSEPGALSGPYAGMITARER